jgi:hypothetical protein
VSEPEVSRPFGARRGAALLRFGPPTLAAVFALVVCGQGSAAERPVHCGPTADSTETYRVTVHRIGAVRCAEAREVARRFSAGQGRRRERADGTVVVAMGRGWRCLTPARDLALEHCRRAVPRATIVLRTLITDLAPRNPVGGIPGKPTP